MTHPSDTPAERETRNAELDILPALKDGASRSTW